MKEDHLSSIRLKYGSYEHECAALNEELTTLLMKLDAIESNGDVEIKKNRKEAVKAIMDLQDVITELHKAAVSLSIFYRSCVSSPRYQQVITQLPVEDASEAEKDIEIPVRVVSSQPCLRRQESVHRVPVFSADEFDAARRAAYAQENLQRRMEAERGECSERDEEMEHALEEERVEEIRKLIAAAQKRKQKALDHMLDETLDEVMNQNAKPTNPAPKVSTSTEVVEPVEPVEPMEPMESMERTEPMRSMQSEGYDDVHSTYQPKYQWLRQGNRICVVIVDVDFDQHSLRCATRTDLSVPSLVIDGYRVVPVNRIAPSFFDARTLFRYVPFTTVIPIPDECVDLSVPPEVMYFDSDRVLQVTYAILPRTRMQMQHPMYVRMPFFGSPHTHAMDAGVYDPYEREQCGGVAYYDPRDEEGEEEEEDYTSPYYCNPYSFRRQQHFCRDCHSPFFGGNIWWCVCWQ